MRKFSAFFILAILLLGLALPASAVVCNTMHVYESRGTACTHPSYELAGKTWTAATPINPASHRIAAMQHGYCTKCYTSTIAVLISSEIEDHDWGTYHDVHKDDGKHIYYQKCRTCDAQAQYTRACGGVHTDLTK